MNNEFIKEIIAESKKSLINKDIPIGAIVVKDGEIIGRGHNERVKVHDVTNHAEIIAIREAEEFIKDWRLDGCDLYVTLEPCDMCKEVIKASRIDNVFYLLTKDNKNKYERTKFNVIEEYDNERDKYLSEFSTFFSENLKR